MGNCLRCRFWGRMAYPSHPDQEGSCMRYPTHTPTRPYHHCGEFKEKEEPSDDVRVEV